MGQAPRQTDPTGGVGIIVSRSGEADDLESFSDRADTGGDPGEGGAALCGWGVDLADTARGRGIASDHLQRH